MDTAYIASAIDNKPAVTALMEVLRTKGIDWYDDFAWTKCDFPDEDPRAPGVVQQDIDGAMNADWFIFLLTTEFRTQGAWAEFGARIGTGKTSDVILNGTESHIFYYHASVVIHRDTDSFIQTVLEPLV